MKVVVNVPFKQDVRYVVDVERFTAGEIRKALLEKDVGNYDTDPNFYETLGMQFRNIVQDLRREALLKRCCPHDSEMSPTLTISEINELEQTEKIAFECFDTKIKTWIFHKETPGSYIYTQQDDPRAGIERIYVKGFEESPTNTWAVVVRKR